MRGSPEVHPWWVYACHRPSSWCGGSRSGVQAIQLSYMCAGGQLVLYETSSKIKNKIKKPLSSSIWVAEAGKSLRVPGQPGLRNETLYGEATDSNQKVYRGSGF